MPFVRVGGTILVLSLALLSSPAALAQTSGPSLVNQRVRLTLHGDQPRRLDGTVQSLSVSSVQFISRGSGGVPSQVEIDSVARAQRWLGRKRNTTWGMAIGGAVGLAAGIVMVVTDEPSPRYGFAPVLDDGDVHTVVAVATTALGALLGAATGSLIKSDRWQDLPVGNLRLGTAGTHPRAPGIHARLDF